MPYEARAESNKILIVVEEDDPLHEQLMWIPGSTKAPNGVRIPDEMVSWRQALRIADNELEPDSSLLSHLMNLLRDEDDDVRRALDTYPSVGYEFRGLFPHQYRGKEYLRYRKRAILADDMGLGKTATAATAVKFYRDQTGRAGSGFPALVIAPSSALYSWADEILRIFTTDTTSFVVTGTAAQKRKIIEEYNKDGRYHKFLIVSFETARSMSGFPSYGKLKGKANGPLNDIAWTSVIVDEAHKIVRRQAQQTRAVWRLAAGADVRYALTGTPVVNNHGDLWSILHFLEPKLFTSYHKFVEYYLNTWEPPWGGIQIKGVKPELRSEWKKLLAPRMRRVTKQEVMKDLPDKTYQTIRVDMTAKQKSAYKSMAKEYLAEVEGGMLEAENDLVKWGKLFGLAQGEVKIDKSGKKSIVKSAKVDALVEILESRTDKKTVVFSDRLDILDAAHQAVSDLGYSTGKIVGEMDSKQRAVLRKQFQEDDLQVLFCSLRAANSAITLTAADTMVFLNKSWSMVENNQAEDRIHRIGQENHCHYIHIVTNGTVEAGQQKILNGKAGTLEEVVRDKERLKKAINGEELDDIKSESGERPGRSGELATTAAGV